MVQQNKLKMTVRKVNIDELMQLLMDMRQTAEYVDIQVGEDNTLRVKKYTPPPPIIKPDKDLNIDDINELIV